MAKSAKARACKTQNVPVRMSSELQRRIEKTAEIVGLSKQDVMRLALERGTEVLIAQLTQKVELDMENQVGPQIEKLRDNAA